MSSVFQKLNSIDNRIKHSVFGYVRSIEAQLSICNIPVLISYITLNYYYHNEYFSKYGQQVKLSNNNMTVTKIKTLNEDWGSNSDLMQSASHKHNLRRYHKPPAKTLSNYTKQALQYYI